MDNRLKEIKILEQKVKETEIEIVAHYKTIGELVSADDSDNINELIRSCSIYEVMESVRKIDDQIKETREKREKIEQLRKKIQTIDNDLKNAKKEKSILEKEKEKHYIGIGETIFSIYSSVPENYKYLDSYYADLIQLQEKIQEIDYKLNEKESSSEDSVFRKIVDSGEKALLLSRRKISSSRFISLYRDAGKKLCDDQIYEKNGDKQINTIFSAYISNLKLIDEIDIKVESLEAEKGNLEHDVYEIMQEFSASNIADPESFLKGLVEKKERSLADAGEAVYFCAAGNKAEINGSSQSAESRTSLDEFIKKHLIKSELSILIEDVYEYNVSMAELHRQINVLNRYIEIDRIEHIINENKNSVERKNLLIKNIKKEIENLNKAIKNDQEKIEELKKEI